MKQYWQRLSLRIDALSLRERAMVFAIAALALTAMVNILVLNPLQQAQRQKAEKIKRDQQQIAAMQAEIKGMVEGHEADPDAVGKARLSALTQQLQKLQSDLSGVEQSVVPPNKMTALLEEMLNRNGKLQLVSLKTLPVVPLMDVSQASPRIGEKLAANPGAGRVDAEKTQGPPREGLIYRHGVQLVVQGTYQNITAYLAQLEAMPWRVFWTQVRLEADDYPKAILTVTLFTLSLDKTWLNV